MRGVIGIVLTIESVVQSQRPGNVDHEHPTGAPVGLPVAYEVQDVGLQPLELVYQEVTAPRLPDHLVLMLGPTLSQRVVEVLQLLLSSTFTTESLASAPTMTVTRSGHQSGSGRG